MQNSVKVQGIASDSHTSNWYTMQNIIMPTERKGTQILMQLEMEIHLVKGLQCHMVIGVDMMKPYGMAIDFENECITWASEEASTVIRVKQPAALGLRRKVKVKERVVIPPFSYRAVQYHSRLFRRIVR